jgi:acetyl esterase/lipase
MAGCAASPAPDPTSTTGSSTTTTTPTTSFATSTTTTVPTTTTESDTTTSTIRPATSTTLPDIGLEILVPQGAGPFPAAVLVHGGGWVAGSPELMRDLARFLTRQGILTVNTPYTLAGDVPGFPIAVDDVACAVRYAAAHPDGDGTVAVIGHSAGAHLSALVALDDGVYGEDCPLGGPVIPSRLVGLAGPYEVSRLGPLMLPFFGVSPVEDPAAWGAGNPLLQVDKNPALSSLLLHGEEDGFVDLSFATDFAEALTRAGSEVLVEVVEGASHNDMTDPAYVGDLIITWLERG